VTEDFLNAIAQRGHEINVHGLYHDGHLFDEREEFLRRADQINNYGREYGAAGFRSPVMYRKPDWMSVLDFAYDMSFPNTAHLDPQRGGCATIMPYFLGDLLETPPYDAPGLHGPQHSPAPLDRPVGVPVGRS